MSDSPLNRFLNRTPGQLADDSSDLEGAEEHGCFGFLRGVRDRSVMVELRKRTGQVKAFGYAWLESAEFDPTDGIALYFPGTVVRIRGANLYQPVGCQDRRFSLFGGILWHRVPWVEEEPKRADDDRPVPRVTAIEF